MLYTHYLGRLDSRDGRVTIMHQAVDDHVRLDAAVPILLQLGMPLDVIAAAVGNVYGGPVWAYQPPCESTIWLLSPVEVVGTGPRGEAPLSYPWYFTPARHFIRRYDGTETAAQPYAGAGQPAR